PLLAPLADNGGPTKTRALGAGSPAIDHADPACPPPGPDQRGVARRQGPRCDIGAFELEVRNAAPVARDGAAATEQETPVDVALSASDADGDSLTFSVVASPGHGTLGPVSGGSVRYTPAAGYGGPDAFMFKANDGRADSNPATVSISVNAKPVPPAPPVPPAAPAAAPPPPPSIAGSAAQGVGADA